MNSSPNDFDYDVVVIGAGTAGLVASFLGAQLGARTLLVEGARLGGECLWTGCVPSKTLIQSARVFETVKGAAEFGVHLEKPRLLWNAVRLRIAAVRDEIKAQERAAMQKSGVEFRTATARFLDAHTVQLQSERGGQTICEQVRAAKFILATGSQVHWPEIDGLRECGAITHQQLFDLPQLPRQLLSLGGGPVAVEMAQAFARLGSNVTLLQKGERLLPREENEISDFALKLLQQAGVTVHCNATTTAARRADEKIYLDFHIGTEAQTEAQTISGSQLLVATGKYVDTAALNLGAAGVQATENGVTVNDYLQTSAKNIWACGDVTGRFLFTHAAEQEAKIAAQNALLPLAAKIDYRAMPWTTFTDPELAHVGLTEAQAHAQHGDCRVFRVAMSELDRAIIDGQTSGFLKIVTTASGRIVGAHLAAASAGELIHPFINAVRDGALLQEFAETTHVYPTLAEIGHRAGNQIYQELLQSKWARALLPHVVKTS